MDLGRGQAAAGLDDEARKSLLQSAAQNPADWMKVRELREKQGRLADAVELWNLMLTSDYTGVDGRTGKTVSKAENIADIKTNTTASADLSGLDVRLKGDTAVITGLSHNKGKDGKGAAFDRTIRFTDVWVKRDGKWQVLSSHGSDVK